MSMALRTAMATGLFCMVFAVLIDLVTDALSLPAVMALSFASGFLGALFAQVILRRAP